MSEKYKVKSIKYLLADMICLSSICLDQNSYFLNFEFSEQFFS